MEYNHEDPFIRLANNPLCGVLISWEKKSTCPIAFFHVERSVTGLNGTYQTILTLPGYTTLWIDGAGSPNYYYIITEIKSDNSISLKQAPISGEEMLVKATVMFHIQDFMRMPVYKEVATFSKDRTKCRFTFDKWSTCLPHPEVEISAATSDGSTGAYMLLDDSSVIYSTQNDNQGEPTKNYACGLRYQLDYQGGCNFFDEHNKPVAVSEFDEIRCSYHVRMFSAQQINDGLNWALQELNACPGSRIYNRVVEAPFWYDAALTNGCVYSLLRQLILSLMMREKRYLFQDPESGSFDTLATVKEMMKEYKEFFENNKKVVPIARYPRTSIIAQEQYNLPGSKSALFRNLFQATGGQ